MESLLVAPQRQTWVAAEQSDGLFSLSRDKAILHAKFDASYVEYTMGPFETVPVLMFANKQLITALQQILVSHLT